MQVISYLQIISAKDRQTYSDSCPSTDLTSNSSPAHRRTS